MAALVMYSHNSIGHWSESSLVGATNKTQSLSHVKTTYSSSQVRRVEMTIFWERKQCLGRDCWMTTWTSSMILVLLTFELLAACAKRQGQGHCIFNMCMRLFSYVFVVF